MMTMNKVLSEYIKNPNDLDGSKKRARDAAKALLPPKAKKAKKDKKNKKDKAKSSSSGGSSSFNAPLQLSSKLAKVLGVSTIYYISVC